jgi:Flp pilus assembly protein CpaB
MTYRARSIVAAIGLAVIAALFVGFYVTNYKRSVQHSQQHVSVFVAARNIPDGTPGSDVVGKGFLRQEQVLRQSVVPGAIANPGEIKQLVASQTTYAGEQVSMSRFSTASVQGIRGLLRGPLRAVQIAGDANQTLAGTLQTGDHIDLVANIKLKQVNGVDFWVDRIVLRNIRVLKAPQAADAASRVSASANSSAVMLLVSDTQVQKLFATVKNEDWTFQLRPVVKATDSTEWVDTPITLVSDGLDKRQYKTALGGAR